MPSTTAEQSAFSGGAFTVMIPNRIHFVQSCHFSHMFRFPTASIKHQTLVASNNEFDAAAIARRGRCPPIHRSLAPRRKTRPRALKQRACGSAIRNIRTETGRISKFPNPTA